MEEMCKKYKLIHIDLSEKVGVDLRFAPTLELDKTIFRLDKVNKAFEHLLQSVALYLGNKKNK